MASPSLVERLDRIEKLLQHLVAEAETASGAILGGTITAFDPRSYTATVLLSDGRSMSVTVAATVRLDVCAVGNACIVAMFGDIGHVIAITDLVPSDPFDPVTGHKHRGILHDGPKLD